jgi:hypothetical protein
VLVWINGPFGGGKTATASELQRRLPGSVVCDPEHLGFGLHRMLPPSLRTDFQSLQAWRSGVREVLDLAARKHQGPVIVPMTLINRRYYEEILGRLRQEFAEHIRTDQQTVPQVADTIARLAALPIRPDTDGPLRGSLRRYATTLRHVRLD